MRIRYIIFSSLTLDGNNVFIQYRDIIKMFDRTIGRIALTIIFYVDNGISVKMSCCIDISTNKKDMLIAIGIENSDSLHIGHIDAFTIIKFINIKFPGYRKGAGGFCPTIKALAGSIFSTNKNGIASNSEILDVIAVILIVGYYR